MMIMVDDDGRGWCSFTIRRRRQHRTTSNFMHHTHHHIQFSHNSRSNGPTSPQQNQNIEKIQMLPRLQRSQSMLLGQPDSKVLARLFNPALLRGKKLFRVVCLAQPLTFFGANCCRKLSIAACLRFGCSAVIAHFLRISATTLQYFCNNTSVFLQHFPSTLIKKTLRYWRGAPTDLRD